MPTLITQEEGPPEILPETNLTMAILPNVAKKKLVQRAFYFGVMTQPMMAGPSKTTMKIPIQQHWRNGSLVLAHTRDVQCNKDTKNKKQKSLMKKNQERKHSVFAIKKDDPASVKLAAQLEVEEKLAFVKGLRKGVNESKGL
jgi:hypothetical protein